MPSSSRAPPSSGTARRATATLEHDRSACGESTSGRGDGRYAPHGGAPWVDARDRTSILLIVAAFFVLGAAVSGDLGITADEPETLRAGQRNLEIIAAWWAGEPLPDWSFHELTGFYFVLDTARALWIRATGSFGFEPYHALHLFHLALSAATIALLYALTRVVGAPHRAALFAALALATLPKFVAHAQTNPKDLPATFVFALALYGVIATGVRGGLPRALLSGAALGLALTTRVHAVFAPLIGWSWLVLTNPRLTRRDTLLQLALLLSGAASALLFWPWLWSAPIDNALSALRGLGDKIFSIPVLYLGSVQPANEIAWHYRSVLLLATTPLSWCVLAGLGLTTLRQESTKGAARLAVLWVAVLWLADGLVWSRYDGIRHFLMALPALALLAGLGADRAMHWVETSDAPHALRGLPLLPFAIGLLSIAALHPYPNAVLGAPARALAGPDTSESYELDYWGQSYREAGRWLATHREPEAEVIVPLFGNLARLSITGPVRDGVVSDWLPTDRPRYLVVLTRRAYWDEPLHRLEQEQEPMFEVRRSGGRLLAIYRNAADSAGSAGGPARGGS